MDDLFPKRTIPFGCFWSVKLLLKALANPYAHSPEQKAYSEPSGLPYRLAFWQDEGS